MNDVLPAEKPAVPTTVHAGITTIATWTGAPPDRPKDVTEAESEPRLGCVAKTTVKDVAEADEIELTVPLLRVTTLPAAVGSKFAPEITSVAEVLDRVAELGETEGGTRTVATTTAVPLDRPKDVTEAERAPALGCAEKVTVKDVEDAAVTVPMAPLPRVTTLPAAVGSKFAPEITSVAEVLDRVAELGITTGAGGAVVGVGTGVGGTQFPDVHVYPDGHVLPQAPQLAADVVGSMQALEQEICGGVQDVAVGSPKSERSAEEAVLSRAVACPCHFCGEVVVDRW